jgi:hypothetical protein
VHAHGGERPRVTKINELSSIRIRDVLKVLHLSVVLGDKSIAHVVVELAASTIVTEQYCEHNDPPGELTDLAIHVYSVVVN